MEPDLVAHARAIIDANLYLMLVPQVRTCALPLLVARSRHPSRLEPPGGRIGRQRRG